MRDNCFAKFVYLHVLLFPIEMGLAFPGPLIQKTLYLPASQWLQQPWSLGSCSGGSKFTIKENVTVW
jgi:hypothetical protein